MICPHCGQDAAKVSEVKEGWIVECLDCEIRTAPCFSIGYARKKWESPHLSSVTEELISLRDENEDLRDKVDDSNCVLSEYEKKLDDLKLLLEKLTKENTHLKDRLDTILQE